MAGWVWGEPLCVGRLGFCFVTVARVCPATRRWRGEWVARSPAAVAGGRRSVRAAQWLAVAGALRTVGGCESSHSALSTTYLRYLILWLLTHATAHVAPCNTSTRPLKQAAARNRDGQPSACRCLCFGFPENNPLSGATLSLPSENSFTRWDATPRDRRARTETSTTTHHTTHIHTVHTACSTICLDVCLPETWWHVLLFWFPPPL